MVMEAFGSAHHTRYCHLSCFVETYYKYQMDTLWLQWFYYGSVNATSEPGCLRRALPVCIRMYCLPWCM